MRVRAVIFDFDGPIIDSFREGLRRIRTLCAVYEIPYTREHHKKLTALWGKPGVELLVETFDMGETFARETFYPAWERLDLSQQIPLIPGTREVLSWLRKNNIAATLLTSRNREHVTVLLDQIDLARCFAVVSTKSDTPHHKPDPRVFRYTLETLQNASRIQKPEIIFVGDTPADVDAGKAADIETLLVQTGPYLLKHARVLPLPLANILNSIDDVPLWIEEHDDRSDLSLYM